MLSSKICVRRSRQAIVLSLSVNAWIFYSPVKGPELCKLRKVTRVGGDHRDSQAACAHGNQRIVGQAPLPDLLVTVLGGQESEHFARLRPVREIRNQNASGSMEVA